MLYIPYVCFVVSLAFCWVSKKAACIIFLGALVSALATHALSPFAFFVVPILFGLLCVIQQEYSKIITILAHTVFTIICFLLFFHLIPGISNFKVFDAILVGEHCSPFTMYLNLENGIIAFLLMSALITFARTRTEWKQIFVSTVLYGALCILTLMGAALALGHVTFNIKYPPQTLLFLLNNLMLVCVAQEVFFRGYIQKNLMDLCEQYNLSKILALVVASVVFGFRHYQSGVPMIILSTIAGLFYGAAYMRDKRIEAAILVHFGLNATHFFLFSYPSLIR